ncbi:MAG: hypothetical protein VX420_03980 [SAR324 cluster bacterium]|nr:hypothetical protein [SAR324 cluster bacterium]MEC7417356.1 hypothetical protein [SAR324 cluster bacterium]
MLEPGRFGKASSGCPMLNPNKPGLTRLAELHQEDGDEGHIVYRGHISPTSQLILVPNPDHENEGEPDFVAYVTQGATLRPRTAADRTYAKNTLTRIRSFLEESHPEHLEA